MVRCGRRRHRRSSTAVIADCTRRAPRAAGGGGGANSRRQAGPPAAAVGRRLRRVLLPGDHHPRPDRAASWSTSPPSGHIAGIWARTDATRGVHKAPANELIRGARQRDPALDAARSRACSTRSASTASATSRAKGIRVWGARTLADAASEWRYLNVRRLFNMIEESIAEATRWIVFEPNDRSCGSRSGATSARSSPVCGVDGALMGRTAERGVLRQVRRGDQPAGSHRRGHGRRDHRHRPGEASRVRGLPYQPARRWRGDRDGGRQRCLKQQRPRPRRRLRRRSPVSGSILTGRTTSSSSSRGSRGPLRRVHRSRRTRPAHPLPGGRQQRRPPDPGADRLRRRHPALRADRVDASCGTGSWPVSRARSIAATCRC